MRSWRSVFTMVVIAIAAGPAWNAVATTPTDFTSLTPTEFKLTASDTEFNLTADDAAEGDHFGWSASVSGDYAVVGARNDDGEGSRTLRGRVARGKLPRCRSGQRHIPVPHRQGQRIHRDEEDDAFEVGSARIG